MIVIIYWFGNGRSLYYFIKAFIRLIDLFNIKVIYYIKTGMRTGRSSGPVLLRHKKMQDRGPVLQVLGTGRLAHRLILVYLFIYMFNMQIYFQS